MMRFENTDLGKLSKNDISALWMDTMSKTVPQGMVIFLQQLMTIYKFKQPGRQDITNTMCVRHMKHMMAEIKVPSIVELLREEFQAATSPLTMYERH
jgi:hypothetical protein